jgi:hypothetical protein
MNERIIYFSYIKNKEQKKPRTNIRGSPYISKKIRSALCTAQQKEALQLQKHLKASL